MESKELRALLIEGIKKIETPKGYKEIISRKNNLYKFDIINRLLIVGQSENAFDVRTQEEWEINGRGVLNNRNKIFILIPNIKSEYKDTETLESIDVSEFTPDELNKALSLGVINRTDVVNNIHTSIVYDIRNTQSLNNGEYSIDKLRIKQSDIFRIAQNILKCNITKSELNYYSNTDDTLYIKNNDEYSNIATYTIDVIVNTCVNQYIDIIKNNYVNDTVDITEYDIELLSNTVKYVMYELFNIEEYIDQSYYKLIFKIIYAISSNDNVSNSS